MKIAYIYKITNVKNDMIYIGQTCTSIEERFRGHQKSAKSKTKNHDCSPLYRDMKDFGIENFKVEQIDYCLEHNKFAMELHWIRHFSEKGIALYNIVGTEKNISRTQRIANKRLANNATYTSEEFRYNMSKVTRGENNGMYGKKGAKAVNGQPVYAFNEKGELQHEFVSVREALAFLKLKGHAQLVEACKDGTEYKGFYWKKEWKKYAGEE